MATWTIPGREVERDSLLLLGVSLVSESARSRDKTNGHKVEIGIRDGTHFSPIGNWDQSSNKLNQGQGRELLGENRKRMRLRKGQQVVARITSTGSPASTTDMALTVRYAIDGAMTGKTRPLVATGVELDDERSREAIENVVSRVNESGLSEFTERIQLIDEPASTTSQPRYVYVDSDAENNGIDSSRQVISSTTYADVNNMSKTFSDLKSSSIYELRVHHTLEGLGDGGNAFGDIQIDIGSATATVDTQDNAAFFMGNGVRNSTSGYALIRFTGETSLTITQQARKVTYTGATTNFQIDASSWCAKLYREES